MFTQLVDLSKKIAKEYNVSEVPALGMVLGGIAYSVFFGIFLVVIMTNKSIPGLFKAEELDLWAKLFVLTIAFTLGSVLGCAYVAMSVVLLSSTMSITSGEFVQNQASKLTLFIVVVAEALLFLTGVGLVIFALQGFRYDASGSIAPMSKENPIFLGMLAVSVLLNVLTVVIPGIASDAMTAEKMRKMAVYKMITFALSAAEKDIKENPGVGMAILLQIGAPQGWDTFKDPNMVLDRIPISARTQLVRQLRKHPNAQAIALPPGEGQVVTAVIVDPTADSEQSQSGRPPIAS